MITGILVLSMKSGDVYFHHAYEPNMGLPHEQSDRIAESPAHEDTELPHHVPHEADPELEALSIGGLIYAFQLNARSIFEVDGEENSQVHKDGFEQFSFGGVGIYCAQEPGLGLISTVIGHEEMGKAGHLLARSVLEVFISRFGNHFVGGKQPARKFSSFKKSLPVIYQKFPEFIFQDLLSCLEEVERPGWIYFVASESLSELMDTDEFSTQLSTNSLPKQDGEPGSDLAAVGLALKPKKPDTPSIFASGSKSRRKSVQPLPFRTPPRKWWRRRTKKRAEIEISVQPIECLMKHSVDPFCPIFDLRSMACLKTLLVKAGRVLGSVPAMRDSLRSMEFVVKLHNGPAADDCRVIIQREGDYFFAYPRHRPAESGEKPSASLHSQHIAGQAEKKRQSPMAFAQDEELQKLISILFSFLKFMQKTNVRFQSTPTTP